MSDLQNSPSPEWSSQNLFIAAAVGAAIGMGDVWKFFYIAGNHGGGAFVLVYVLCLLIIGVPLLAAEIIIGQQGQKSPVHAFRVLLQQQKNHSQYWQWVGWMAVAASFLILSYYVVIAGIALAYAPRMAAGLLTTDWAFAYASREEVQAVYRELISDPERLLAWHTVMIVLTMIVVGGGLKGGIEKVIRFTLPIILLILAIFLGYALQTERFAAGFYFLFKSDFQQLFYPNCPTTTLNCPFSGKGILTAMGLAFFTLSLGRGVMMTYAAYLPQKIPLLSVSLAIVLLDALIAIIAGLAIYPLVADNGVAPNSESLLIFITLPHSLGQLEYGAVLGSLFFLLLVLAAWMSAIALSEVVVAWLSDTYRFSRPQAAVMCGVAVWLLGLLNIFSLTDNASMRWLNNQSFLEWLEFSTSYLLVPLSSLFIGLFGGWVINPDLYYQQTDSARIRFGYKLGLFILRYITPISMMIVFLNALGIIT